MGMVLWGMDRFYLKSYLVFACLRKLLASKFQPTDARKAFPCFDEPQLKAIFKISIIHPENTIALANFPSVYFI